MGEFPKLHGVVKNKLHYGLRADVNTTGSGFQGRVLESGTPCSSLGVNFPGVNLGRGQLSWR